MAKSARRGAVPELDPERVRRLIAEAHDLETGLTLPAAADRKKTPAMPCAIERGRIADLIGSFDEDEQCELLALAWIGRGDYTCREWRIALAEARHRREKPHAAYLLDLPLLPQYLATGLSEFGLACADPLPP